jgi:hypothetical protein
VLVMSVCACDECVCLWDIDQFIANIDKLLTPIPHICTTGGPFDSADDFSLIDARRNTYFRVPLR